MRLLIVSNRLPVTVAEIDGKLRFKESVGGLVSGLGAYLDVASSSSGATEYVWIGWPGIAVNETLEKELKSRAIADYHAVPVFLSEKAMEKFYHGFCNRTIWPLFHYFPSYAIYYQDYWSNYRKVNEAFCKAVLEIVRPDDVIWIHDYHLMLLPGLLRKKISNQIGFFLHIPFPSYEIFRLLPRDWRREILLGMMGADLIGFHTHSYTQYFLRGVLRILGHEHNMGKLIVDGRIIKADTFPMGIDFQKFHHAPGNPEIQNEIRKIKETLSGSRMVFSLDRLDYTKGIINRLQGYEIFLEKNRQWHEKVILMLRVVPSRTGVEHYQQMKKQIDEMVGRINGKFGSITWTPISYQYRFLPFNHLIALYAASDVALVTPLRDGMNLVAKEYIATRTDKTGVLILSEMAGASQELGEAVTINPNNMEEIAAALRDALEMPIEDQVKRNHGMQKRLRRYDVFKWGDDFIQKLLSIRDEQDRFQARLLNPAMMKKLVDEYKKAKRRLIFLDYDGTLVPFAEHPEKAKPGERLLENLKNLSGDSKNEVVLISGRDKATLQDWFGTLNIGLAAEHGAWIKERDKDWRTIKPLMNDWKPQIQPILELYADRLPGAFVEVKDFSLAWHYRMADPELSSIRVKELTDDLISFTANIDVQVLQGAKVIEIRNSGINKGIAGKQWISMGDFDFVVAIGDDWTDEDLFKVLPKNGYSIKLGMSPSHARFSLSSQMEVQRLIEEMIAGKAWS